MRLGEHKHCMDGYRRILSLLPMEDGEHFMQLSKDMAKYEDAQRHIQGHVTFSLFFLLTCPHICVCSSGVTTRAAT